MNYVYILQSVGHPEQFYTGLCKDVDARLSGHNAGQSPHTSKFKPWRLLSYRWFERQETAAAFERYLKSGSGRAFANKRLRSPGCAPFAASGKIGGALFATAC